MEKLLYDFLSGRSSFLTYSLMEFHFDLKGKLIDCCYSEVVIWHILSQALFLIFTSFLMGLEINFQVSCMLDSRNGRVAILAFERRRVGKFSFLNFIIILLVWLNSTFVLRYFFSIIHTVT